jgi:very-short-patch-repair endonuclease
LLRQDGYYVLRFLADDAGRRLDQILDAILAALIYREKNKRR